MPVMPAGVQGGPRRRAPTAFDKWKMGAMLGGSVGLIMGFLWGGFTIVRYGGGPDGPLRLLSKYMIGSGATFGFFMSIGSVIRTEGPSPMAMSAWEQSRRRPMIMPRTYVKKMEQRREV